jgi:hypothetical protein
MLMGHYIAVYNALYSIHNELKVNLRVNLLNTKENPQFFPHFETRERVKLSKVFNDDAYGDIEKPFIRNETTYFVFTNSDEIDSDKRSEAQIGSGSNARVREFVMINYENNGSEDVLIIIHYKLLL